MNLKELRTKNHLTQTELADAVGVTQAAIANYENGTRRPKPSTAKKISDHFGLNDKERWDMLYSTAEESEAPAHDASPAHP